MGQLRLKFLFEAIFSGFILNDTEVTSQDMTRTPLPPGAAGGTKAKVGTTIGTTTTGAAQLEVCLF